MNKSAHAIGNPFPVIDDCMVVGGIPITRLAERVGQTPFYAYSRSKVAAQVELLRRVIPADIKLHYAIKANPFPMLVRHVAELVDGLDVASSREINLALDTGTTAHDISFAGPGKRDAELRQAIAAGILINAESSNETRRIHAIAQQLGICARVALRINPAFDLKAAGMKMGGGPKQFGIDQEEIAGVLNDLRQRDDWLAFEGFQLFPGSQNLNADNIIDAQNAALDVVAALAEAAPGPVRCFNLGGGFGVPYFPGDRELDVVRVGEAMHRLTEKAKAVLGELEIVLELGRYLVASAGLYVTRITDRKISRGEIFHIVDGGMHHHLAASGNLGQIVRRNYPVLCGNRVNGVSREVATIVGPLCTPLDLLADKMEIATADVGDLVVILQSGAYGLSASPVGFLSQPSALEVLVD
ncbi:pyridoxal-dependent decarboxylase, exosortase A system-associated [Phyllobacterium salinisoli]|uniref:Pyridoxal-dependent decarboxylase, exosortase A system-associated n=1 Tax=Phyllobacterium salinisoli TaxID=1899321 RepID=A0A368JWG7_9HYPH|nr:pyridoxal-dependent decarboxylase, exosortase A system-associated [Phyllobacterium salinisoli]RCS21497.1 pyridoxal-dependent decarboxylase, exosortase A system-associated [Phyllobacterium salinisoli]